MYIAHVRESDKGEQSVEEHLLGVKRLAETYGGKVGAKHVAGLAGMLHDMGKFTNEFQTYIMEAVNNPDTPPRRGSVDHSTAGGKLLFDLFHRGEPSPILWGLIEVVGNAIISHHSYLHDYLNPDFTSPYLVRVRDKECPGYEQAKRLFFEKVTDERALRQYVDRAVAELQAYLAQPSPERTESKLMFLTKFVFSALIDADRTNTRQFEEHAPEPEKPPQEALFQDYYQKLMVKIDSFRTEDPKEQAIHRLRRQMSDQCEIFAEHPPGIYTLSIPTGGGKTLASFRYALRHALKHGLKRIVYIVPFTTIIEQNAEELRRIIEDEAHLLEHHSNVVEDADASEGDEHLEGRISVRQKLNLARDNWDVPIVMTTLVQFLDVFYARGSRNIRRLHNLGESVIIFDEVQKVPIHCVALFNHALNFLKTYARSSMVLCTATQPALDYVEHRLEMNTDGEMIGQLGEVMDAFKRVEMVDLASEQSFTTDKLADLVREKLQDVRSVLVILNTKTVVRRLYEAAAGIGVPVYHLSTSMCPAHRNDVLKRVKAHLADKEPVLCISTQLIEAGVDVSFDCVIRSLAGLDSVAQAAGRCNRHGKNGIQHVYVIDHEEERLDRLKEIQAGKRITKRILEDLRRDSMHHGGHMLSLQAMDRYFKELYTEFQSELVYRVPKLSDNDMVSLLTAHRKDEKSYHVEYKRQYGTLPLILTNSYRTAAEHFEVIKDLTDSVLVPYGERGKEIIAELNGNPPIERMSGLLREAQHYSVNVYRQERDRLSRNDGIVTLAEGSMYALKESAYSKEYGVNVDNDGWMDAAVS